MILSRIELYFHTQEKLLMLRDLLVKLLIEEGG